MYIQNYLFIYFSLVNLHIVSCKKKMAAKPSDEVRKIINDGVEARFRLFESHPRQSLG